MPAIHDLPSQCPSRLAFGGGSFAGITALMVAMQMPHVFGSVLVESPSLWVGEGRFLQVWYLAISQAVMLGDASPVFFATTGVHEQCST